MDRGETAIVRDLARRYQIPEPVVRFLTDLPRLPLARAIQNYAEQNHMEGQPTSTWNVPRWIVYLFGSNGVDDLIGHMSRNLVAQDMARPVAEALDIDMQELERQPEQTVKKLMEAAAGEAVAEFARTFAPPPQSYIAIEVTDEFAVLHSRSLFWKFVRVFIDRQNDTRLRRVRENLPYPGWTKSDWSRFLGAQDYMHELLMSPDYSEFRELAPAFALVADDPGSIAEFEDVLYTKVGLAMELAEASPRLRARAAVGAPARRGAPVGTWGEYFVDSWDAARYYGVGAFLGVVGFSAGPSPAPPGRELLPTSEAWQAGRRNRTALIEAWRHADSTHAVQSFFKSAKDSAEYTLTHVVYTGGLLGNVAVVFAPARVPVDARGLAEPHDVVSFSFQTEARFPSVQGGSGRVTSPDPRLAALQGARGGLEAPSELAPFQEGPELLATFLNSPVHMEAWAELVGAPGAPPEPPVPARSAAPSAAFTFDSVDHRSAAEPLASQQVEDVLSLRKEIERLGQLVEGDGDRLNSVEWVQRLFPGRIRCVRAFDVACVSQEQFEAHGQMLAQVGWPSLAEGVSRMLDVARRLAASAGRELAEGGYAHFTASGLGRVPEFT